MKHVLKRLNHFLNRIDLLKRSSLRNRAIIVFISYALSIFIFFMMDNTWDFGVHKLVILPTVLCAWIWGLRGAMVSWLMGLFISSLLIVNLAIIGTLPFVADMTILLLVALVFGKMSDVNQSLQEDKKKWILIEKELQESEAKFRTVVNESNDGIYILDNDQFVFINPRFTQILGYKLEEISRPGFEMDSLLADEGKKVLDKRDKMIETGQTPPARYEFMGLCKDGKIIHLETSTAGISWNGKKAKMGIIHDITEKVNSRNKLEEAFKNSERANQVKDRFLANVSHEIRTPLNAIIGFTDLIYQKVSSLIGEEEKSFFKIIDKSSDRLLRTLQSILDISQLEAKTFIVSPESVCLVKLLKQIVKDKKSLADSNGVNLQFNPQESMALINADRYSIEQALDHLVDNAVKYTQDGEVDIRIMGEDGKIKLIIKDTGIGISEKYQKNLFEAFSQESSGYTKKFQGIGLGLTLAKQHLDLNDVRFLLKSDQINGTTITLIFNRGRDLD